MAAELIVVNTKKIVHETIDDEVIVIDLETGLYYSLVDAGVDAWDMITRRVSRERLVNDLARLYNADRAAVEGPVNALLDDMLTEGIIVIEPGEDEGEAAPPSDGAGRIGNFAPPVLARFNNMSDLLLLDPIHDVDEQGWPRERPR